MQEGRIVRGPQGQRGIIRNGRIVPLKAAEQAGVPQLVVPPQPKQPPAQTPLQQENDALTNENIRDQMRERGEKRQEAETKANDQITSATDDILRVIERMDRVALDANDNRGTFETGRSGAFMRSLPGWVSTGSAAFDLQRDLDLVGSNAAIETLMQMRRESPTGAGVGNVALGELQLMKDKYGTFDPNQSHETFLKNVAEGKQEFLDKLKRINPQAYEQYLKKEPSGIWLAKDGSFKLGRLRIGVPPEQREPGETEFEFLGFEE